MVAEFQFKITPTIGAVQNLKPTVNSLKKEFENVAVDIKFNLDKNAAQRINTLNKNLDTLTKTLRQVQVEGTKASAAISSLADSFKNVVGSSRTLQTNVAALNREVKTTSRGFSEAEGFAASFGRSTELAAKRFGAFIIAAGAINQLTNSFAAGIGEALRFQREMVRLGQVTDAPLSRLNRVQEDVTKLSTSLGVSSQELLKTATTFAQAGVKIQDVGRALEAVAEASLAPNFKDMNEIVEGSIAIFSQFKISSSELKNELGSINAVAAQFAVESADILTGVRKAGGAFAAAGGSLKEFTALFTTVRDTTRESADTIATGLRTIFTRLQRPQTIENLKALGVELRFTAQEAEALGRIDLKNQFVGPAEAIRRIQAQLQGVKTTDPIFAGVVEELGGVRQISKVIPLLQEAEKTQRAFNVAQFGGASIAKDAARAQDSLLVQVTKVKEEFLALFRAIADNKQFQDFVKRGLELASALIKITDALKGLLPLIATFAASKIAANVGSFFGGFREFRGGTPPIRRAGGGFVPGVGNGDSVHAMLEPGEFVLRKSAVNSLTKQGVSLPGLNKGGVARFATGGLVRSSKRAGQIAALGEEKGQPEPLVGSDSSSVISFIQERLDNKNKKQAKRVASKLSFNMPIETHIIDKDSVVGKFYDKETNSYLSRVENRVKKLVNTTNPVGIKNNTKFKEVSGGYILEGFIQGITGKASAGGNNPLDFIFNDKSKTNLLKDYVKPKPINLDVADAKRTTVNPKQILRKAISASLGKSKQFNAFIDSPKLSAKNLNELATDNSVAQLKKVKKFFGGYIQKFAGGGLVDIIRSGIAGGTGVIPGPLEALLSNPPKELEDFVGGGASFLGSGAEAVALRKRNGNVVRIGRKVQREFDPNILQAIAVKKFGDITAEILPFAEGVGNNPRLTPQRMAAIQSGLSKRLASRELDFFDNKPDNIGRIGRRFKVIDPGATVRFAGGGFAAKSIFDDEDEFDIFSSGSDDKTINYLPGQGPIGARINKPKRAFPDAITAKLLKERENRLLKGLPAFATGGNVHKGVQLLLDGKQQKFSKLTRDTLDNIGQTLQLDDLSPFAKRILLNSKTKDSRGALGHFTPRKRGHDITLFLKEFEDLIPDVAIRQQVLSHTLAHEIGHGFDFELGRSIDEPGSFASQLIPDIKKLALLRDKLDPAGYDPIEEGFADLFADNTSGITFASRPLNPKTLRKLADGFHRNVVPLAPFAAGKKFAKGGAATDTVPALLTPGEFVLRREAAQRLGPNRLHSLNRGQLPGFAKGGFVQHFKHGGETIPVDAGDIPDSLSLKTQLTSVIQSTKTGIDEAADQLVKSMRRAARKLEQLLKGDFTPDSVRRQERFNRRAAGLSPAQTGRLDTTATASINIQDRVLSDQPNPVRRRAEDRTLKQIELEVKLQQVKEKTIKVSQQELLVAQDQQRDAAQTQANFRAASSRSVQQALARALPNNGLPVIPPDPFLSESADNERIRLQEEADAKRRRSVDSGFRLRTQEEAELARQKQLEKTFTRFPGQQVASADEFIPQRRLGSRIRSGFGSAISGIGGAISGVRGGFANLKEFFSADAGNATRKEAAELANLDEQIASLSTSKREIKANKEEIAKLQAARNSVQGGVDARAARAQRFQGRFFQGSLALGFGADALNQQLGTASASSGAGFQTGKATAGAITGGAIVGGALAGAGAGPVGIIIGASLGAIKFGADAWKEAGEEIRAAKIGAALSDLEQQFRGVTTLKDLQQGSGSLLGRINEVESQSIEQAISKSTGFFTGFDAKAFASESKKELRTNTAGIVPELGRVLGGSAEEVGRTLAQTNVLAKGEVEQRAQVKAALENSIPNFNELTQKLSSLTGIPLEKVLKQFNDSALGAAKVLKSRELQLQGSIVSRREFSAVTDFANVIRATTLSLKGLDEQFNTTLGLINGNASVQQRSFASDIETFGLRGSNRFQQTSSDLLSPFGQFGASTKEFIQAFDEVKKELPSILVDVLKTTGPEVDVGAGIEEIAGKRFQNRGKAFQSVIGLISDQGTNIGKEELQKRINGGDVSALLEDLTKAAPEVLRSLTDLARSVDEHNAKFANSLAQQRAAQDKLNEQLTRQANAESALAEGRARVQSDRTGQDFFSLFTQEQAARPFNDQQRRLLQQGGLGGANINDAGAIGDRLRSVQQRFSERQNTLLGSGKPISDEANKELSSLASQANALEKALQNLTRASERNADIQNRLNNIKREDDSRKDIGRVLAFGTPEERFRLQRGIGLVGQFKQAQQAGNATQFVRGLSPLDGRLLDQTAEQLRPIRGNEKLRDQVLEAALGGKNPLTNGNDNERAVLEQKLVDNLAAAANAEAELSKTLTTNVNNLEKILQQTFVKSADSLALQMARLEQSFATNASITAQGKANELKGLQTGLQGVNDVGQIQTLKNKIGDINKLAQLRKTESALNNPLQIANNAVTQQSFEGVSGLGTKEFSDRVIVNQDKLLESLTPQIGEDLAKKFISGLNFSDLDVTTGGFGNRPDGQSLALKLVSERLQQSFDNFRANNVGVVSEERKSAEKSLGLQGVQNLDLFITTLGKVNKQFEDFATVDQAMAAVNQSATNAAAALDKITSKIIQKETESNPNFVGPPAVLAQGNALGGLIYRAAGGSIFQPRGTDTVPAMLTPGEFVVNAKATQQFLPLLQDINGFAKGGPVYLGAGSKKPVSAFEIAMQAADDAQDRLEGKPLSVRFHSPFTGNNINQIGKDRFIDDAGSKTIAGGLKRNANGQVTDSDGNILIDQTTRVNAVSNQSDPRLAALQALANSGFKGNVSNDSVFSPQNNGKIIAAAENTLSDAILPQFANLGVVGNQLAIARNLQRAQLASSPGGSNDTELSRFNRGLTGDSLTARNIPLAQDRDNNIGAFNQLAGASFNNFRQRRIAAPFFAATAQRVLNRRREIDANFVPSFKQRINGRDVLTGNSPFSIFGKGDRRISGLAEGGQVKPRYMATGGVTGGGNASSKSGGGLGDLSKFSKSLNEFNTSATNLVKSFVDFGKSSDTLSKALSAFPHSIEMKGTHDVKVTINGAEILSTLEPTVQKLIVSEVSNQMQRVINDKFPGAGLVQNV